MGFFYGFENSELDVATSLKPSGQQMVLLTVTQPQLFCQERYVCLNQICLLCSCHNRNKLSVKKNWCDKIK